MKQSFTRLLLTLLMMSIVVLPFNINSGNIDAKTDDPSKSSQHESMKVLAKDMGDSNAENEEQVTIIEHRISASELEQLKQILGVSEEGVSYNQIIDGHGTGLTPPSEDEWIEISSKGYVVDRILLAQTAPSAVDHTTKPWFPPIGDQDGEGSCVGWAVGYYVKTFQEAKEHNWDLSAAEWKQEQPTEEYQSKIISPEFIYQLINGGEDSGASFSEAINLVCSVGACTWEKMPYDPVDHSSWPSEEAWREAPLYRGNSSGYEEMPISTDEDIVSLKNWIASGNLAIISVDSGKYSLLTNNDVWTVNNYIAPEENHANTIVGYDDQFSYFENGQTRYGAFKVANSWGVGGWQEDVEDGCFWISYAAMKEKVKLCMFFRDRIGYEPELVASFKIAHSKRGECNIAVGVGDNMKMFNEYMDGGDQPFCSNNILFDVSEIKESLLSVYNQTFFLDVYDGHSSTTGTIQTFGVEYAQSENTPLNTVNNHHVRVNVTLLPLEKNWMNETLVSTDIDFIDTKVSMASDSNGYLYAAYEDWYPTTNHSSVFILRSIDDGKNWSLIRTEHDPVHNLAYPSIAIDQQTNDIFVAYEREMTTTDHDIYVLHSTSGLWSSNPVANDSGSDERFPSITSEQSYGESNRQYISYEYVHSRNDRDLMFAKSTDHGVTWSTKKLHGDWPDYNVHAQTSITNAYGYVYIAYKWGADYDADCEIRVDCSADSGNSWNQYNDIDGLPNGCSFPQITATHNGNVVVLTFQYESAPGTFDVCYSFSATNGTSWMKGYPLFDSAREDETSPKIGVDADGCFYAVCKSNNYVKYREALYDGSFNWSTAEFVSERLVGDGLALTTQLDSKYGDERFYPCVVWTDAWTRNIWYSTRRNIMWTVDDDGSADFQTMREAINFANDGDTVYVRNGIYPETVFVNKSVLLMGENKSGTIIDGDGNGTVLSISAEEAVVQGFTIRNGEIGIEGSSPNSNGSTVSGNNIYNCNIGIRCGEKFTASYNEIENCTEAGIIIYDKCVAVGNTLRNNRQGMLVQGALNFLRNNTMENNEFGFGHVPINLTWTVPKEYFVNDIDQSNTVNGKPIYYWVGKHDMAIPLNAAYVELVDCTGIHVHGLNLSNNVVSLVIANSRNCLIENLLVSHNLYWGVTVCCGSVGNTLRNNFISSCETGVELIDEVYSTEGNWILDNNVSRCIHGIKITGNCTSNQLFRNNVTNNTVGISLSFKVNYNIVCYNNISGNTETGIYIERSSNNSIVHNNFLSNTCQIHDTFSGNSSGAPSVNWWNDSYPGFGNYWSSYNCVDLYSGLHQNVTGADGIGDSPYVIDGNNNDEYPLMKPYSSFLTDLNSDGNVDIIDITMVATAYNSTPRDSNWNPLTDLDNDALINILDISLVAIDFGKAV